MAVCESGQIQCLGWGPLQIAPSLRAPVRQDQLCPSTCVIDTSSLPNIIGIHGIGDYCAAALSAVHSPQLCKVCCVGGMRSTRSTSALSNITHKSPVATRRAMKGRRTHGSQTALNFLAGNCSPSSPHRIPRSAEVPQGLAQSAPVSREGLLASEGRNLSHGQSYGWSHEARWPSANSSPSSKSSPPPSSRECSWRLNDSSEGLAALR